jgi:lipoate-protein ligase A
MRPHLDVYLEPELDGAAHMRRDAELLAAQRPGSTPVLRLYSWSPPAVSLGFMQRADDVLDADACRDAGVDIVRRPTGGRAVLHWEEITYAIVGATDDPRFGTELAATHARIGACLAAGLRTLGVEAALSRPARDPERRLLRAPCFVSPGRAELLVDGRKLLGSAQRRTRTSFLQHGSLLVGTAHERLADLQRDTRRDPALATALRTRLRRETITLSELLGRTPAFPALAAALVRGFAAELDLEPRLWPAASSAASAPVNPPAVAAT